MIKVIKAFVAVAGLAMATTGFVYWQVVPLDAYNGRGVLVPCKGAEKYGSIEGGIGYQSYEERRSHAYACEREYHDRSKWTIPLMSVGGAVMVGALAFPTRRKPRNDPGDTTYQLNAL